MDILGHITADEKIWNGGSTYETLKLNFLVFHLGNWGKLENINF